ncbi:hypothetical protein V9K35_004142 [Vibrio alginolyticus]
MELTTVSISLISAICSGVIVACVNYYLRKQEYKAKALRESKEWQRNQSIVHIEKLIDVVTRIAGENWRTNEEQKHVSIMEVTYLCHLSEIYLSEKTFPKISKALDEIINAKMATCSDDYKVSSSSSIQYAKAKRKLMALLKDSFGELL